MGHTPIHRIRCTQCIISTITYHTWLSYTQSGKQLHANHWTLHRSVLHQRRGNIQSRLDSLLCKCLLTVLFSKDRESGKAAKHIIISDSLCIGFVFHPFFRPSALIVIERSSHAQPSICPWDYTPSRLGRNPQDETCIKWLQRYRSDPSAIWWSRWSLELVCEEKIDLDHIYLRVRNLPYCTATGQTQLLIDPC